MKSGATNRKYDISRYDNTVEDVAKLFHWTPWRVRFLAREGVLPGIKRLQKWFFCKEELAIMFKGIAKEEVSKNLAKYLTKHLERINEKRDPGECDIFS